MSDRSPPLTVVTGAASGIGLATVNALRRDAAASVIGVDIAARPEALRDDAGVAWVSGDVSDQDTWAQVLDTAGDAPDALVTCAGVIAVAPFLDTADHDWRRLFEVNVMGVVRGMRALLPAMIRRGEGAVAAVCSVDSLIVEQSMSAYATSKAALLHAIRSAAVEHAADGIRINAVCPGIVDTPLLQEHFDSLEDPASARRACEKRSPIGRLLRPEEVAEVLCFLVSKRASAMAGAAVTVDGGLIATYDFDSSARSAAMRDGQADPA
jgi:NAD(P)-dependent dehydrogenase (short-subunit alcohol dehydrogenase family)